MHSLDYGSRSWMVTLQSELGELGYLDLADARSVVPARMQCANCEVCRRKCHGLELIFIV